MTRAKFWLVAAGGTAIVLTLGAVTRNQVRVYRGRQARAAVVQQRRALFDAMRPVALANCQLERFGEPHDGGYLMCANLLSGAEVAYSYGISGYDQWGCDISTRLNVIVHQYDCFDTTQPACPAGRPVFHAECVGDTPRTVEGRLFDTMTNQFAKNGDSPKRIVMKIDVEGAEWNSFLSAPDETLGQIEQMSVEFHWAHDAASHWVQDTTYLRVVQRLKQFFEIAHIHFNNYGCVGGLEPFPTWAFEVLFVNKRLAIVDPSGNAAGLHPFDAPNNPAIADCQPDSR